MDRPTLFRQKFLKAFYDGLFTKNPLVANLFLIGIEVEEKKGTSFNSPQEIMRFFNENAEELMKALNICSPDPVPYLWGRIEITCRKVHITAPDGPPKVH